LILVVNLNLAVDRSLLVKRLRAGAVHRAVSSAAQAGGKGVNVARVLKTLGEQHVLTGFVGGAAGDFITERLFEEGINFRPVRVAGESRTCYVIGEESGAQTVVNEPGPEISPAEWSSFIKTFETLLDAARLAVVTGSLPPGLPEDSYARLVRAAQVRHVPAFLDCAGEPLRRALTERPALVKVNREEAATLAGEVGGGPSSLARAALFLRGLGARRAVVTDGAAGAALAVESAGESGGDNYEGAAEAVGYLFKPPAVAAVNGVGSGDAAMAGLAAGFVRGMAVTDACALAVAAGAANALRGFGRCTAGEIEEALRGVRPEMVPAGRHT
jgi:tagatose 6-phosphate kinase